MATGALRGIEALAHLADALTAHPLLECEEVLPAFVLHAICLGASGRAGRESARADGGAADPAPWRSGRAGDETHGATDHAAGSRAAMCRALPRDQSCGREQELGLSGARTALGRALTGQPAGPAASRAPAVKAATPDDSRANPRCAHAHGACAPTAPARRRRHVRA